MAEDEKQEVEKLAEEKKKEVPWWQKLHPVVLGAAGLGAFLLLRSIQTDVENRNTFIFWLIALLVVVYLIAQTPKAKEEEIIAPKEADLLVERECERKRRWGQFGPMVKYDIGPISNLLHRDGKGVYYDVSVEVASPYDRPRFFIATVQAKGPEKGFVYFNESIAPITGREKEHERNIIPDWFRQAERRPLFEKILFREK